LLIAHNNGRLSYVQLLCLEDELKRNDFAQSNFPYNIYAPFNWENYDEVTCQDELRFEKADKTYNGLIKHIMGVNLVIYRAAIGTFNNSFIEACLFIVHSRLLLCCIFLYYNLVLSLSILLLLSGSVHPNPGPRQSYLSIAHLNARSLNICDKISEISVIAFQHKFDLFAFSETWLNPNFLMTQF
jgi:hypothetical protein